MLEEYLFSKNTKWILLGVLAVVAGLLIFLAGIVVGSHESMRGHIPQNAGPQGPGAMGGFMQNIMPRQGYVESGHGAIGTIATVTPPTFTLITRGGTELKVFTGTSTTITGGSATSVAMLQTGQFVVVVGEPTADGSEGYLDARIIHILPAPTH